MIEKENALISGILEDAERRADDIIQKAKLDAEDIIRQGKEDVVRALEDERRTAEFRIRQLELKEESAKRNIDRLSELKNIDASYQLIMERVDRRIDQMVEDGSIRNAIVGWIVEAAIGLDLESAVVSSSKECPVDEKMLKEASDLIYRKTGATIELKADRKLVGELGVVVSSEDGFVRYDNLLSVRKRRYMREIRKIVQEENARQNSR